MSPRAKWAATIAALAVFLFGLHVLDGIDAKIERQCSQLEALDLNLKVGCVSIGGTDNMLLGAYVLLAAIGAGAAVAFFTSGRKP